MTSDRSKPRWRVIEAIAHIEDGVRAIEADAARRGLALPPGRALELAAAGVIARIAGRLRVERYDECILVTDRNSQRTYRLPRTP
jgi:hypothetical protein